MQSVSVTTKTRNPRRPNRSKKGKAKPKPKSRKRQARKQQALLVPIRQKLMLSHCSKDYLRCLTDPFSPQLDDPCIPDLYDFPTRKIRTIYRGVFNTSTAHGGFGFVIVAPWTGLTQDLSFIAFTSDGTYTGTTLDTAAGVTGIALDSNLQFPYVNSDYPSSSSFGGLASRLVGCGLRVRYIGTELARGGQMLFYRPPQGMTNGPAGSGLNNLAFSDMSTDIKTKMWPVTKQWRTMAYIPQYQSSYNFDSSFSSISLSASPSYPAGEFLVCAVNGASSSGGTGFEFEIVQFSELTGVTDSITKSHSDIVGLSAVRDATANTVVIPDSNSQYYNQALGWIESFVNSDLTKTVATKATESALKSLL